jgi:AcrR family transcriptional regulator
MTVDGEKKVRGGQRLRDPERTKKEILEVATEEFAKSGFAGARVDEIASR